MLSQMPAAGENETGSLPPRNVQSARRLRRCFLRTSISRDAAGGDTGLFGMLGLTGHAKDQCSCEGWGPPMRALGHGRKPTSKHLTRCSYPFATARPEFVVSHANVPKSVPKEDENGPRSDLRGPFLLVAGTGFEPATSGL
jgi:hypothetical protein